ncbi:MAG: hypothetical protein IJ642_02650 [Oscillospiraceae bacterium]|nr:hypothetical protein [Oscillospiraceae bacterium]
MHQADLLQEFLKFAGEKQWHIEENTEKFPIPEEIFQRYSVPESWLNFIAYFSCCASPEENFWLLTCQDYQNQNAFAWNEAEQLSLASAQNETESRRIKAFWNQHIPIAFRTDGDYVYYAIRLKDGAVISGCEPEFEECEIIAGSFPEFIRKLIGYDG